MIRLATAAAALLLTAAPALAQSADSKVVLTFETEFFGRHGFTEIEGTPVNAEVYEEMRRSYDVGVAEFLDLSYVKPNIMGNTRMLLVL